MPKTELSRSKLASIVSATIMDKCQQFIDKVSELRFLKIKERQVNKFNRLLFKKQGNITWFSTVPLVNPWAGSASPQVARTSAPRQVVPGKTALLRQPAHLPPKHLVLRQSALPRQLVPGKKVLLRQPVLLPPKQLVLRQSALNSSQVESTDPQAVSASVSQAVSFQEDSTVQAVRASSPKTVSYQAVSSPQAVSFWEDSASQAASTSSPPNI